MTMCVTLSRASKRLSCNGPFFYPHPKEGQLGSHYILPREYRVSGGLIYHSYPKSGFAVDNTLARDDYYKVVDGRSLADAG